MVCQAEGADSWRFTANLVREHQKPAARSAVAAAVRSASGKMTTGA
jgi:hypothetical protein